MTTERNVFTTEDEISDWLYELGIEDFTINEDLSVDVDCNVDISDKNLTFIPVNFNNVNGSFYCNDNNLLSLEGSPKNITGEFSCYGNKLKDLKGCTNKIFSDFSCYKNELTNFEDFPQEITGSIVCHKNLFTSLDGLSIVNFKKIYKKTWYLEMNNKLKEEWFNKNIINDGTLKEFINF